MHKLYWAAVVAAVAMLPGVARPDDLDELQEKAVKAAVGKVAPCVVKIETSGGTEIVRSGPRRTLRRGTGPTTGLIVRPDGYVISSAFNFANKPSSILVAVPGIKERKVARVVATDQTRMLTLLKLTDLPAGAKLPVATPAPKADVQIGVTAVAVGRTLSAEAGSSPSVSVGIISALDRIWGKAVQTDAKVSPTNYGGPLIDLQGRVQGVLVPASPDAEGETAGFEWYDSGIGFAIPLTDINAVLPRMLKGTEKEPVTLRRGYLGVTMKSTDIYEADPVIGTVAPRSAGEKAGLKPGDRVLAVEGHAIRNYAQLMHRMGARYEGDTVSMKVMRGTKEMTFPKVVLGSAELAAPHAFLGVLPLRDDPAPGVEIRYVYPKSPAAAAGLKAGDRILKASIPNAPPAVPPQAITRGRDQLMTLLDLAVPGLEMKFEVKRKATGKTQTVSVKLGELPDAVPDRLPETASAKKALTRPGAKGPPVKAPAKKPETGLLKKTTPAADHTYWVYVPDNYDPNIAYSVVVWLHPLGKNRERDFEDVTNSWANLCEDNNLILICPQSDNQRGWTPGEADFVVQAVRTVASTYTVDMRRVVAHGMGVGGEMALYLGFQARTLVRGVATVAAHLGSNPREKVATQPLSFFLVVGGKDPLKAAVVQTRDKLTRFKYPVSYREVANMGHEYIDGKAGVPTLEELVRWIDSLDRI
jgi:S1-C subfamily serine protease/poly(3-hydroxybutyrate) depolymerase